MLNKVAIPSMPAKERTGQSFQRYEPRYKNIVLDKKLYKFVLKNLFILRLFGRVELSWNTYGRVHTVDTVPRRDVFKQRVVELIQVDCTGASCTAPPDLRKFVRHSHRLTYARLQK